ncbi:MAG: helix-turn-helix transcriptional regulator [Elusimicrobiales bacterium]|nr:helix-turn-helix transcriptional regulator [Elusimicrobiales bacterium]
MKSIGEKLKAARTACGLKQSDVAARIGCAPTTFTNWENGKVNPSLDVLSKLCEVYNIDPLSLPEHEYSFEGLVGIARKPVSERTYEETIALNFSEPLLAKLLPPGAAEKAVKETEETAAFLNSTKLLSRFGSGANRREIDAVREEYEAGTADADILFAYHSLNRYNKAAFLAMLCGLLRSDTGLEPFADKVGILYAESSNDSFAKKIESAKAYTLNNLDEERERLSGDSDKSE